MQWTSQVHCVKQMLTIRAWALCRFPAALHPICCRTEADWTSAGNAGLMYTCHRSPTDILYREQAYLVHACCGLKRKPCVGCKMQVQVNHFHPLLARANRRLQNATKCFQGTNGIALETVTHKWSQAIECDLVARGYFLLLF